MRFCCWLLLRQYSSWSIVVVMSGRRYSDARALASACRSATRASIPYQLRRRIPDDRSLIDALSLLDKCDSSKFKAMVTSDGVREAISRGRAVGLGLDQWRRLIAEGVWPGEGGTASSGQVFDSAPSAVRDAATPGVDTVGTKESSQSREQPPTSSPENFELNVEEGRLPTGDKKGTRDACQTKKDKKGVPKPGEQLRTSRSDNFELNIEEGRPPSSTTKTVGEKVLHETASYDHPQSSSSQHKQTSDQQRYEKVLGESQQLSSHSKERKVPSSRFGRVVSFGNLAMGLGAGAVAELSRRNLGLNKEKTTNGQNASSGGESGNPFLTNANVERIVETLCRVRGAALKLGQMLSIQDTSVVPPAVQEMFERVRNSADFMPSWQLTGVLRGELGENWRELFVDFDEKPFAAASIGQVHRGTFRDSDGSVRELALKIQYPGVADSIDSDINNLMSVLNVGGIFPKGLYLDSFVNVVKYELAMECDYEREMRAGLKFRSELLKDMPEYYVPTIFPELSTKRILTAEMVDGIPLDKCQDLDQQTRDWLGEKILSLCVKEMFLFRFMQTDPNWSNFYYNPDFRGEGPKLILLDFGASRPYRKRFIDTYLKIIKAAVHQDRNMVLQYSRDIGFLTGFESKAMEKAHCDAVLILGEAFFSDRPYDFAKQDITRRMQTLVKTMLEHRLTPPPEEIYSLHRKLSGAFLLCAKLQSRVNCKPVFDSVYDQYAFGYDPNEDRGLDF